MIISHSQHSDKVNSVAARAGGKSSAVRCSGKVLTLGQILTKSMQIKIGGSVNPTGAVGYPGALSMHLAATVDGCWDILFLVQASKTVEMAFDNYSTP
jgi:hypothetical protein